MKILRLAPFALSIIVICLAIAACSDSSTNSTKNTKLSTGMWTLTRIESQQCNQLASATADTIMFSYAICNEDVFEDEIADDECETIEGDTFSWDCRDSTMVLDCKYLRHATGFAKVEDDKHYSGEEVIVESHIGSQCANDGEVCTTGATFEARWWRDLEPGDCDTMAVSRYDVMGNRLRP